MRVVRIGRYGVRIAKLLRPGSGVLSGEELHSLGRKRKLTQRILVIGNSIGVGLRSRRKRGGPV